MNNSWHYRKTQLDSLFPPKDGEYLVKIRDNRKDGHEEIHCITYTEGYGWHMSICNGDVLLDGDILAWAEVPADYSSHARRP